MNRIAAGTLLLIALGALGSVAVAGRGASPTVPSRFAPVCEGDGDSRPDPAWTKASYAADGCWAPVMPVAVNGHVATRAQVVAAMAAAKRYAALSDGFRRCIGNFLAARQVRAAQGGTVLAASLVTIENHRIAVNLRESRKAADQARMSIEDFNAYGSDCPD